MQFVGNVVALAGYGFTPKLSFSEGEPSEDVDGPSVRERRLSGGVQCAHTGLLTCHRGREFSVVASSMIGHQQAQADRSVALFRGRILCIWR